MAPHGVLHLDSVCSMEAYVEQIEPNKESNSLISFPINQAKQEGAKMERNEEKASEAENEDEMAIVFSNILSQKKRKRAAKYLGSLLSSLRTHEHLHTTDVSEHDDGCIACRDYVRKHGNCRVARISNLDFSDAESTFSEMLSVLIHSQNVTECEIASGIILFSRLIPNHWNCGGFSFFANNVFVLFAVCCFIGQKLHSDRGFSIAVWGRCFALRSCDIRMMELGILELLDWDTRIHREEYESIVKEVWEEA
ncbi:hypothetical protein BLNAU_12592 [Blattamonas nauphoetae]|uniref:Uncharacterized protein n=1 Tax=Blattamonas nauphoetae TaxID=2049346 RepID=A0ABQ9XKF2_9EUKA|nr:hypothetical protein BLNAU_12592 [Blattamonas nauphoetae]